MAIWEKEMTSSSLSLCVTFLTDRTLYLTCCQDIIKTQETLSSAPRIDDSRTCQKEVFLLNSRRQLLLTVRNKPQ